eukprot:5377597-Pleurochrysis_carterae.AAC.1
MTTTRVVAACWRWCAAKNGSGFFGVAQACAERDVRASTAGALRRKSFEMLLNSLRAIDAAMAGLAPTSSKTRGSNAYSRVGKGRGHTRAAVVELAEARRAT